jgi:hypothetical protein
VLAGEGVRIACLGVGNLSGGRSRHSVTLQW